LAEKVEDSHSCKCGACTGHGEGISIDNSSDIIAERYYDDFIEFKQAIEACECLKLDYTVERVTNIHKQIITGNTYEDVTYKLKIKES
jgi:hypothetical protein